MSYYQRHHFQLNECLLIGNDVNANNVGRRPRTKCVPRIRTSFTRNQLRILEDVFVDTKYISKKSCTVLANILCLPERHIHIWFQNRRIKQNKINKGTSMVQNFGQLNAEEISHKEIVQRLLGYSVAPLVRATQKRTYSESSGTEHPRAEKICTQEVPKTIVGLRENIIEPPSPKEDENSLYTTTNIDDIVKYLTLEKSSDTQIQPARTMNTTSDLDIILQMINKDLEVLEQHCSKTDTLGDLPQQLNPLQEYSISNTPTQNPTVNDSLDVSPAKIRCIQYPQGNVKPSNEY